MSQNPKEAEIMSHNCLLIHTVVKQQNKETNCATASVYRSNFRETSKKHGLNSCFFPSVKLDSYVR